MTAHITGIGVVSPLGLSREEHWKALLDGCSGLGPTRSFDSTRYDNPISGEVPHFSQEELPSRLLPATDRMTQMSLVAAAGAFDDSGIDRDQIDPLDIGVMTASTAGGYAFGQKELQNLWSKGPKYVSTHQSYAWFYAVNTGQISIRHGCQGHSGVIVADDAGGLDAIATAARRLARGNRVMLTGSVDSTMCPWGRVAHTSTGHLSKSADPRTAYLPFDERAGGWVNGEGGAHLVLRSESDGRYASVLGHGATVDDPRADPGAGLVQAIRLALDAARLRARDIGVVFADAAGTRQADGAEAAALAEVFGRNSVPVTAPKAATGRMGCGTASLDVATAVLALRDQMIPPTVNVEADASLGINLCTAAAPHRITHALVLARGIGGFNSALIVGA
ncbi:ketosynthase chain-length factor [Streptomyces sp. H27-S2]|uniref:ketosynthase chain-length factor n=1 Tax=Streptomyces antarcticus TaxID=2996458 RepID=UPI00226E040D|nr:ketosynthase chain-length factor [Streptomyces sp. H27-S2]MCY0947988.1 ketosynthase chain-length factor [Streptomyces sp. H27-S2]